METTAKKKWQAAASRRTTAVYFKHLREMRLVKRAARVLGIPWTRFIRLSWTNGPFLMLLAIVSYPGY